MAEQHAENLWNNRTLAIEALNKVAKKNIPTDARLKVAQNKACRKLAGILLPLLAQSNSKLNREKLSLAKTT
jgi:hypothetical protein